MPRQHERVPVSLEIILDLSTGRREARVSDLSRGGCFVDTIIEWPLGERIFFILKMPDGESMYLSGTVAHAIPGIGFGIKFGELAPNQRNAIFRVIFAQGGKISGYTDARS